MKGIEILLDVDFEDLATSEHGDVDAVIVVNGQASWEDFLDLSLVSDINEDLLVGCVREQNSSLKIN
jgi:hypothetical protein